MSECITCGGAGEVCLNPWAHLSNPAALSFTTCPSCDGSGEQEADQ